MFLGLLLVTPYIFALHKNETLLLGRSVRQSAGSLLLGKGKKVRLCAFSLWGSLELCEVDDSYQRKRSQRRSSGFLSSERGLTSGVVPLLHKRTHADRGPWQVTIPACGIAE